MIYVRALIAALRIPYAIRHGKALIIRADVADLLLREAVEIGPAGRPWVNFILRGRA
ncbi:MAG TPA: hypothetical protein VMR80_10555 [Candidatus Acidoferrum sp.]|nr:hypothetical protein [Candidatus Acidoferrum sp.]